MADSHPPTVFSIHSAASQRQRGTGSPGLEQLFPLPLAPFEAMTHYDSWPNYPMSCGAVFRFKGRVNRAAFIEATAAANRRHPLIEANIVPSENGRLQWEPADTQCTVRWIGESDATDFAACVPYDLQQETGVRLWVQQRGNHSNVYSEFHHSCCDGAGGLSYMEDIFAIYANLINSGSPEEASLPVNDPSQLSRRGVFTKARRPLSSQLLSTITDLQRTITTSLLQPTKLGVCEGTTNSHSWQPRRFVTRVFGRDACLNMRKSAAAVGATMNDFLLNALSTVIRDWNSDNSEQPIRILVPVNLRGRTDLQMGLTNRMSYAFVDRPSNAPDMGEDSLRAVATQSALARNAQLPLRLLEKFSIMQATGLWPLVFSPNRCLATAAFSNLGDPSRRFRTRFPRENGLIQVGNLVMHQFEGTTALRPNTRAGLFVNTYGNQLSISVRLDPTIYSISDAETFLDRFAGRIEARPTLSRAA